MDALLRRFVQWLAGEMIGHMIPYVHQERRTTGFYTRWVEYRGKGPALAGRRSIQSGLGCLFQDGWRCHLARIVMLRGRWFGLLRLPFCDGFSGMGFECGEDDGGCLLDDFQTLCE